MHKQEWTDAEDKLILSQGRNLDVLADKLERSVHAIYQRRAVLRKRANAPEIKHLFTEYEDEMILRAPRSLKALSKKLNRPISSLSQRRKLLGAKGVVLPVDNTPLPVFSYTDPLDRLFEPDVPTEALAAFEQWWHQNSPPMCYDREQVQMAWLHGYAANNG